MKKELYDTFYCRADKCEFSCCDGWEIHLNSAECKRRLQTEDYTVRNNEKCPFECPDGLCRIVKEAGEENLPDTCHEFPRMINEYEKHEEYTLSFGCPYVLDLLEGKGEDAGCGDEADIEEEELYIRDNLIHIIKNRNNRLDIAILTAWLYLAGIPEGEIHEKIQTADEELLAMMEVNLLFQDIVINYLELKKYEPLLKPLWEVSEEIKFEEMDKKWRDFRKYFSVWDDTLRYCIAEKIYYACVSEEISDMLAELQVIICEYVMIRYACFLQYIRSSKNPEYADIRRYNTIFSRILGHNADAVKEFFQGFSKKPWWDTEYAILMIQ